MKYLYLSLLVMSLGSCGASGMENVVVVTMNEVCMGKDHWSEYRVDCGVNPTSISIEEVGGGSRRTYQYPMTQYLLDRAVVLKCEWDRDVTYYIRWYGGGVIKP